MKRLSASLAASLLLVGTSLIWSTGASVGQPPKTAPIQVAGKAQNITEDQNFEHSLKQLETEKKELLDLFDGRLTILEPLAPGIDFRA